MKQTRRSGSSAISLEPHEVRNCKVKLEFPARGRHGLTQELAWTKLKALSSLESQPYQHASSGERRFCAGVRSYPSSRSLGPADM
jgi:hypothetical protein